MSRQTPKTPYLAILFAAFLLALVLLGLFNSPPPYRDTIQHGARSVTVQAPPQLFTYEEKLVPVPTPYVETAPPPPPLWSKPSIAPSKKPQRPFIEGEGKVAIIIDDVGISNQQTLPLFDLPKKLTLSFLPYGHATPKLAARAAEEGYEILLHMPMQPMGHDNPGPDAIMVGMNGSDIAARLANALKAVPQAIGVNNHMGSAATADTAAMKEFMAALQPTGKFFIDSYTSAQSVAYQTARAVGISAMRRDVFLDNDENEAAALQQLYVAESVAKKHGYAIAIGHPYPSTIAALSRWLAGVAERGVTLVTVGDLMRENHANATPKN